MLVDKKDKAEEKTVKAESGTQYIVTTPALNCRALPDSNADIVKTFKFGETVAVSSIVMKGADVWGKTKAGWVNTVYCEKV